MPVPFLQLFSILIPSTNHNQLESSRVVRPRPRRPHSTLGPLDWLWCCHRSHQAQPRTGQLRINTWESSNPIPVMFEVLQLEGASGFTECPISFQLIQFSLQSPVQNWSHPPATYQLFCLHSWKHLKTHSIWNLKMMISKLGISSASTSHESHEMHHPTAPTESSELSWADAAWTGSSSCLLVWRIRFYLFIQWPMFVFLIFVPKKLHECQASSPFFF